MKRLYQEPEWKKHSENRQYATLSRTRLLSDRERRSQKRTKVRYIHQRTVKGLVHVDAPVIFSLLRNPEDTLRFFEATYDHINSRRRVFLNLRAVQELTTDAMVYILSMIAHAKQRGMHVLISGNSPDNPDCHEVLENCGFYKYVFTGMKPPQTGSGDVFAIESGIAVEPTIAGGITGFVRSKLQGSKPTALRQLYRMVIECMANTRNHAYRDVPGQGYRWWIMASHHSPSHAVDFVFIDNGLGIPMTVRKKLLEKVIERVVPGSAGFRMQDADLIASSLRGEFRTATRLGQRGKGLPSMREAAENKMIESFRVLSRHGVVDVDGGNARSVSQAFRGTMLSWRMASIPDQSSLDS
jgi:hypothetical protein